MRFRHSPVLYAAVLTILTFLQIFGATGSRVAQRHYQAYDPDHDWATHKLNDPQVGEVLPISGEPKRSPRHRLVVWMGSCTSCSFHKVLHSPLLGMGKAYSLLLAGHSGSQGAAQRELLAVRGAPEFIELGSSEVATWNAYFAPRSYVLDAENRLVQLQQPDQSLRAFLAQLPQFR